jgi:hypothetical protein
LRGADSVSVLVGVGWTESYLCFFCWRFSLRLWGNVGKASLEVSSGLGGQGSSTAGFAGVDKVSFCLRFCRAFALRSRLRDWWSVASVGSSLSSSLSSGVELCGISISESATGIRAAAVGLATCARVLAFDMTWRIGDLRKDSERYIGVATLFVLSLVFVTLCL